MSRTRCRLEFSAAAKRLPQAAEASSRPAPSGGGIVDDTNFDLPHGSPFPCRASANPGAPMSWILPGAWLNYTGSSDTRRGRCSPMRPSFGGLLVVNKPQGITSRAAVDRAKGWFPPRTRLGHTGTLDPLATGVLVLC